MESNVESKFRENILPFRLNYLLYMLQCCPSQHETLYLFLKRWHTVSTKINLLFCSKQVSTRDRVTNTERIYNVNPAYQ